jgi:hypothetical protein
VGSRKTTQRPELSTSTAWYSSRALLSGWADRTAESARAPLSLARMETGLYIIGMLYLALSVVAVFNLFMQPRARRRRS